MRFKSHIVLQFANNDTMLVSLIDERVMSDRANSQISYVGWVERSETQPTPFSIS